MMMSHLLTVYPHLPLYGFPSHVFEFDREFHVVLRFNFHLGEIIEM